MSYVDEYAQLFREAADRQARSSPFTRARRLAPRAGVALAVTAAVAALVVLPGVRVGERAANPVPPDDPIVIAYIASVRDSDVRREPACRPPRPGAKVSDAPMAPETRAALGVLRRPGRVPRRFLRGVRRWGDPRATMLAGSLRLLGDPPRALLYVMRGPYGRFAPRDPELCTELMQAELARRTSGSSDEVREGARRALDERLEREQQLIADPADRLYLAMLDDRGRVAGGGGGVEVAQVRRTGMGSSGIVRVRGRRARVVQGLVPDEVHSIEIVARGAGDRPWVRRHRVDVRDNYFRSEPFHAASFRVRWLDARGDEIDRGKPSA